MFGSVVLSKYCLFEHPDQPSNSNIGSTIGRECDQWQTRGVFEETCVKTVTILSIPSEASCSELFQIIRLDKYWSLESFARLIHFNA